MKANEAPKKIYIRPLPNHSDGYVGVAWDEPHKTMVEYVRTDAFIEKALAYLNEKFYFNNLHYAVENNTFNCMEEMFEGFRNYMEGE